jgi:phosphatidylserine decarboxylase
MLLLPEAEMKKLWFALLFFAGGFVHEVRNPVSCQCIAAREFAGPRKRSRP